MKGNKRKTSTRTVIKNNKIVSTTQEISGILVETFHLNSSDKNYQQDFLAHKMEAEKLNLSVEDTNDDINKPFTFIEINEAIKHLRDKKCPGLDGIPSEFIKHLPYLLALYNHLWINKKLPNQWREVTIFAAPKPNKNKANPDNYRPIAASNNLRKILQIMVNNRLNWYLKKKQILNNNQSGFRKQRSTVDNILFLTTEVQKAFKRKENTIAVFFDI